MARRALPVCVRLLVSSPRRLLIHLGRKTIASHRIDDAEHSVEIRITTVQAGEYSPLHFTQNLDGRPLRIGSRNLVDDAFLLAASDKNCPEGVAVETLLCGAEVDLPAGITFTDHTGRVRSNMRACWWELPASGIRYDQLVFPPHTEIPDDPVSEESFGRIPGYALDAPPVFFGHYLKPAQSPLYPERHNVACLDHSAAMGGPLVAYRWNGGSNINPEHYICHS